LGPSQAAFGIVDSVLGEGGAEVPGFVATKNEILQVVRLLLSSTLNCPGILFTDLTFWENAKGPGINRMLRAKHHLCVTAVLVQ
jgi:hypothetical protein